jgi:hypothetical protein
MRLGGNRAAWFKGGGMAVGGVFDDGVGCHSRPKYASENGELGTLTHS